SGSEDGADSEDDGVSESTTGSETATDTTAGVEACEPGMVRTCECGRGPGAATCNRAGDGYSDCMCCGGTHPLVDGEIRSCEEGHCYCGDLEADPPLDACYAEVVAEVCCSVALECY
ncbi:MAG: hypothetical protein JKY37_14875, partial [Nannocystaceae bacterium]|nr:hypothetical protein [Nannocystaceae bacterium]